MIESNASVSMFMPLSVNAVALAVLDLTSRGMAK
jgi:hypothetical protein